MNNYEARLKEQRTNEATVNNYIGSGGKIALVAKRLGQPIYDQGGGMVSIRYLEDPLADHEEIPTMEEFDQSYEIGYLFDGLSRGVNMSILYQDFHREITVRYEGKVVYKELAGELDGYVPGPWELKLAEFVKAATRMERMEKPSERRRMIEKSNKRKKKILEELKDKWGGD